MFLIDKEIATYYNRKDTIIEIRKKFPSAVLNNKVDKNALANIVFNDKIKLVKDCFIKLKTEQSFG